jgi:hypothetical protein
MQLVEFRHFVCKVLQEGHRLQKVNIAGQVTTKRPFTQTQIICFFFSMVLFILLPRGINDNFAEYAIAFLGIFVGLFTSIIISLYDKGKSLYIGINEKNSEEKAQVDILRNYLVQFTGLTAYSIILALVAVILLLGILLFPERRVNVWSYYLVSSFSEINSITVFNFFKVVGVSLFRIGIFNILLNFFAVTLFSLSSYFSFLHAEYKELGIMIKKKD